MCFCFFYGEACTFVNELEPETSYTLRLGHNDSVASGLATFVAMHLFLTTSDAVPAGDHGCHGPRGARAPEHLTAAAAESERADE